MDQLMNKHFENNIEKTPKTQKPPPHNPKPTHSTHSFHTVFATHFTKVTKKTPATNIKTTTRDRNTPTAAPVSPTINRPTVSGKTTSILSGNPKPPPADNNPIGSTGPPGSSGGIKKSEKSRKRHNLQAHKREPIPHLKTKSVNFKLIILPDNSLEESGKNEDIVARKNRISVRKRIDDYLLAHPSQPAITPQEGADDLSDKGTSPSKVSANEKSTNIESAIVNEDADYEDNTEHMQLFVYLNNTTHAHKGKKNNVTDSASLSKKSLKKTQKEENGKQHEVKPTLEVYKSSDIALSPRPAKSYAVKKTITKQSKSKENFVFSGRSKDSVLHDDIERDVISKIKTTKDCNNTILSNNSLITALQSETYGSGHKQQFKSSFEENDRDQNKLLENKKCLDITSSNSSNEPDYEEDENDDRRQQLLNFVKDSQNNDDIYEFAEDSEDESFGSALQQQDDDLDETSADKAIQENLPEGIKRTRDIIERSMDSRIHSSHKSYTNIHIDKN